MIEISGYSKNENLVWISADSVKLPAHLDVPENAQGVVLFASGSGSSRDSYRNRFIAQGLHQSKLATLLIDLLTPDEEAIDLRTRHHLRFDIGLLAPRVVSATDWLLQNPTTRNLKIGYFGTNTGSATVLMAATEHPNGICAIVSRGGRPELAGSALSRVKAPTLLIVAGNDIPILQVNQEAFLHLHTTKQLEIISGATHLFEEQGALEEVARLASQWFNRYLVPMTQQDSSLSNGNEQRAIGCS
ncbi:MAG TPA: dienelactone hydrolase family protein [Coleofasciculaceae cyanobacterium]